MMENALALQTPDEMREKIVTLEAVLLAMPQVEIETTHHFAPGIYMRQVRIPAGVTVTGKIHKTEHLNILSAGVIQVMTDEGIKTLTASTVIKSQPGIKRAGHALEESVWITVHPNPDECRDVALLEERIIAKTFAEVPGFTDPKLIEGGS